MSKQDKKDTTTGTTTSSSKSHDKDDYLSSNTQQSLSSSSIRSTVSDTIDESRQSLDQAIDETKRNIEKNTDEARTQIPRYTQSINDLQQQTIQATKEIADHYLEYQREAISSIRSIFEPYIEETNNYYTQNNPQEYFIKRLPTIYSKISNNIAENTITANRIMNDLLFANIDAFKTIVNSTKDHSKHLSEIGKRNARVYGDICQDNNSNNSYR
jgi:hypothetical protein